MNKKKKKKEKRKKEKKRQNTEESAEMLRWEPSLILKWKLSDYKRLMQRKRKRRGGPN